MQYTVSSVNIVFHSFCIRWNTYQLSIGVNVMDFLPEITGVEGNFESLCVDDQHLKINKNGSKRNFDTVTYDSRFSQLWKTTDKIPSYKSIKNLQSE